MAFTFGAPAGAPASSSSTTPASTAGGAFKFNTSSTAGVTSTPASTRTANNAPAPAFGASTTTAQPDASTAGAPPAVAATGVFTFSSLTSTASTASASGQAQPVFSSGSTTPTSSATSDSSSITVPEFKSVFPNLDIAAKIETLLKALGDPVEGNLAGQELLHILQCQPNENDKSVVGTSLSTPCAPSWVRRNDAFRSKLQTYPKVKLYGQEAVISPEMMREMWELADDLRIGEMDAITLYAAASDSNLRRWLETRLDTGFVDASRCAGVAPKLMLGTNVPKAARELYFYERSAGLATLLTLLQHRIDATTEDPPNDLIFATDQLIENNLVENLVKLVRQLTDLADILHYEHASRIALNTSSASFDSKHAGFESVLLSFSQKQRQTAAECLFYLTYHTQCEAQEIASVVDLIKDVTNGKDRSSGLPVLDPYEDVPTSLKEVSPPPQQASPWQTTISAPLPTLEEKDVLQWQKEVVNQIWERSGKPQLLKCVGVLIMSVINAMDRRHVLIDRKLHGPNSFGEGNAILPPSNDLEPESTEQLLPLHSRLDPNSDPSNQWRRKDIWGLLTASYALLLIPPESALSSPRRRSSMSGNSPSPSSRRGAINIRSIGRSCLEVPTQMKSFTFARLTLIPSFEKHSFGPDGKCDNFEFLMSTLSEFVSRYLDILSASGSVPISREQWKSDEETELQVQRGLRDQQQQFTTWTGESMIENEVIPSEVDLLKRPDCMDDVIALAVSVCSAGPEYASHFWSVSEHEFVEDGAIMRRYDLVPSRTLKTLERLQAKDSSLLSAYLSFLAVLATAKAPDGNPDCTGATVVHSLLSSGVDLTSDSPRKMTWSKVFEIVRWYARELSQSASRSSTSSTNPARSNSARTSRYDRMTTNYYLYAGNVGGSDSSGFSFANANDGQGSTSSTTSKPKELGEANAVILLSHLRLIANVASNSSAAQSSIMAMNLPVGEGAGQDPVLTILFSLAVAPLSPTLRGAVLLTISNVLRVGEVREQYKETVKEAARKAWDLLEESQLLPIAVLDQYPPRYANGFGALPGIAFPPSSTSQVSDGAYATPWMPPDVKFGIIYEIEHVQSRMGYYPSAEGLLHLLTSLVSSGGCPSDLGSFWRIRCGCSPYIEFVIHYLLPRAMAAKRGDVGLPFRTLGDKSRLVGLALELIEAVVSRYNVPSPRELSVSAVDPNIARRNSVRGEDEKVDFSIVMEHICVEPTRADRKDFVLDFRDDFVGESTETTTEAIGDTVGSGGTDASRLHTNFEPTAEHQGSYPRPKSPGFHILLDILSSEVGDLFKVLAMILAENFAARGVSKMYGEAEYRAMSAIGLFGGTPPTFNVAKRSPHLRARTVPRQSLLQPPFPADELPGSFAAGSSWSADFSDGTNYRELSVIHSTRILCAAAAREMEFAHLLNAAAVPLQNVPVLRFERVAGTTTPKIYDSQVSRLVELIRSHADSWINKDTGAGILSSVVDFIGYVSSSWKNDTDIAGPATMILCYVVKTLSSSESYRALCDNYGGGEKRVAAAVARRLQESSRRVDESPQHADVADSIFGLLLRDLRAGSIAMNSDVSAVLLGAASRTKGKNSGFSDFGEARNCFDVVLQLLSRPHFVSDRQTSRFAAQCYEIVYRMIRAEDLDHDLSLGRIVYTSERLRKSGFWVTNFLLLLGNGPGNGSLLHQRSQMTEDGDDSVLHCLAWFLKGVSTEIKLLMGLETKTGTSESSLHPGCRAPRPSQCRELLTVMFGGPNQLLFQALCDLPLKHKMEVSTTTLPAAEIVKSVTIRLPGPIEVVGSYSMISTKRLIHKMGNDDDKTSGVDPAVVEWAKIWNARVLRDCAATHLADSLRLIIGSAIEYSRPTGILLHGVWEESTYGAASLGSRSFLQLLSLILSRIANEFSNLGDEETLFSSAAVQFTMTALILVPEVKTLADDAHLAWTQADTSTILCLLARAAAAALNGPVDFQAKERTAILGSALAFLVQSQPTDSSLHAAYDQTPEAFISAALAQVDLGCNAISAWARTDKVGARDHETELAWTARSSLSALLRCTKDEISSCLEESFVYKVLTSKRGAGDHRYTALSAFLQLLEALDDNICNVLLQISLCKFGTELLHDAKIISSMILASKRYFVEEGRVQMEAIRRNNQIRIGTPPFLSGYLMILNAMLSRRDLAPTRFERLVHDTRTFIAENSPILERLVHGFPVDGDVIKEFTRCLSLVSKPLSSRQSKRIPVISQLGTAESTGSPANTFADFNKILQQLVYQLAAYPFPSRYLPLLPRALDGNQKSNDYRFNVVLTSGQLAKDWWSIVERDLISSSITTLPAPPLTTASGGEDRSQLVEDSALSSNALGWSDQHYEFSIQGAEILDAALSCLNHSVFLLPLVSIDCTSLAKGFCRCADAALTIESTLLQMDVNSNVTKSFATLDLMDTGDESQAIELSKVYLTSLGPLLGQCAEKLLVLCVSCLRAIAREAVTWQGSNVSRSPRESIADLSNTMLAALDYTQVEERGIGCVAMGSGNVKRRLFAKEIAQNLKKELQGNMKRY